MEGRGQGMRTLKLYLEAESLSHWELHETLCRNISLICSIYIFSFYGCRSHYSWWFSRQTVPKVWTFLSPHLVFVNYKQCFCIWATFSPGTHSVRFNFRAFADGQSSISPSALLIIVSFQIFSSLTLTIE